MANSAKIGGLNIDLTELLADTSPQLGGNLDLNSNDITGTGNVNTTGTITASSTITGNTFSGSGASLTNLNASNLASGTIPDARFPSALPAVDGSNLTGINTDLVADTTPQLGGDLDTNSNNINFADNDKAQFGASQDLQIYHNGNHSFIREAGTGDLRIQGTNVTLESGGGEIFVDTTANGSVDLYYDNTKKLETTSTGASITGNLTTTGTITPGTYRSGEIIEELHAVCNTTSLHGRATIQNVTAAMTIPESPTDATGSVVTSYTPPTGTKMIVYEYTAHLDWDDAHAISHWRLFYQVSGGTWTEVTKARTNRNGYYPEDKQMMRWVFEVDATSDDSTLGIFNAATPQLGFKWQVRDYGTGNERGGLHRTTYWDGAGSSQYSQPMIMIKAIA